MAGEARAAGQAVVDENAGQPRLGMQGNGNAAEVVAVGHDLQGQQADERVLQSVDGAHEMQEALLQPGPDRVRNHVPEAFGFKDLGRHVQRHDGQQPVAGRRALFIAGNALGDPQPAPADQAAADGKALRLFQDVRAFLPARAREPGNVGFFGADRGPAGVHFLNNVRAAPVQVDRAGMGFAPGPEAVHRADDSALLILDAVALARAAQVHQALGPLARGQPLPAVGGLQQQALLAELAHGPARARGLQPGLIRAQGQFGGGAFQMPGQNDLVVRIDHGLFRRAAEKILGIAGEILV